MGNIVNNHKTTCCYCGVGCGILVEKDRRGNINVKGDPTHPVNKGMLCSKGMNLHYTVMDQSDRLLYPRLRLQKDQPLRRVSWDAALEHAATVFKAIIREHGPDAVGFYISGQCLTEEYYLVNKLVKGFIGTNNIDTNSRLCMSSAVSAYKLSLGEDAVPISYEDIELADCFLVAGANPAWCHPIIFRRMEAHKAKNPDVRIILVDPRKTQTAALADLHLQINPGTDIVLYNAIARGLIENDFIHTDFIAKHTEGFEALKEQVMKRTLQEAAAICGIKFTDIYRAVKYIGASGGFITMWAMGLNQSVVGVNKNLALINLSLITGKIGRPGSGPFSLTGQPNAMGGREVGGMATLLSAHRDLNNPLHRKEVADHWGVPSVPGKPGLTATEMFASLRNRKMKAIWIICTNPLVSLPDARLAEEALERADFVVVQDISSRSDTVKYADLLLPAAGWLEKEGTMTNSERRINYLPALAEAPGEALPDAEIIRRFAAKMGWEDKFNYSNAAEIYAEHAALTKDTCIDISGLNHERLQKEGSMQWPVPDSHSLGTPRLFTDHRFYTADKKAKLHALRDENNSEPVNRDFPLILTTGRIRDQWHTMTKTGKVGRLKQHIPHPFLEMHPFDAEKRGIREGDPVKVNNEQGEVTVTVRLSEDIKKGVVFLPMHWGKIADKNFARANNLTRMLVDPVSKQPDFKFSAVQVAKFVKPSRKMLIVGSDISVFYFLRDYRRLNPDAAGEIGVFCSGTDDFYDRSLLPEYIGGSKRREELSLMKNAYADGRTGIHFHPGVNITGIDKENKIITDDTGARHGYDILVLAAGSKPRPPSLSLDKRLGVFMLNDREEAERFREYVSSGDRVAIAGSDISGLRLAVALQKMDLQVILIHPGPRLLERELDEVAGELLIEELRDCGVSLLFNETIAELAGDEAITGLRLAGGETIACKAFIYASGYIPDRELAEKAGLSTAAGGIAVNEYLQTPDPDILVIGPAAAYHGQCFDTAEAGEEQAAIAAGWLSGNMLHYYGGSLPGCSLSVNGWTCSSLGLTSIPPGGEGYEEIISLDKYQRYYKKCIIRGDKLAGAILMGDQAEYREFKEMIRQQTELVEKRAGLLRPGKQAGEGVTGRLICSCNSVGEGNLIKMIRQGCSSMEELCRQTGAGMGCGSCRPEVKNIWSRAKMK